MDLALFNSIQMGSSYLFRLPAGAKTDEIHKSDEKDEFDEGLKDGKKILCRQCRQLITTTGQRIEVEGAHQHTFFNPHGIVYEIGCFRSVTGCRLTGPVSKEFSWFAGYGWRISVCSRCLVHLGWLFLSDSGSSFSGLVLNRLIEDTP